MRRVVVTGASSGLGLALARHYLALGATVGAIARRAESLAAAFGDQPSAVRLAADVRDAAAMQTAASRFLDQAGAPDLVIGNAGVSVGTLTDHAADAERFRGVVETNLLGLVHTFQPFLAPMRAAGDGVLAGIASVAGLRGLPGAGAYSASKAAAITYLESLRVELRGSGVDVVTVCPGYVRTPMTARNPYRMPFILDADEAARRIARIIARRRRIAVVPWQMAIVARILRMLPPALYDALFARAPRKPRADDGS
ncbi:MAG: SDR family oxidoreductase [Pseudomonadota bacterium]